MKNGRNYRIQSLLIPVELNKCALQERKINELKLLIYLKFICSGNFRLSQGFINYACKELNIKSTRIFIKYLKWLAEAGWIEKRPGKEAYKIHSFIDIASMLQFRSRKSTYFDYRDFPKFRAYAIGSVISYYANYLRKRNMVKALAPELKSRRSRTLAMLSQFPLILPLTYYAKVMNISKSTACKHKQEAIDAGYIVIKKRFKDTGYGKGVLSIMKLYGDVPERIRLLDDKVCRQEPDVILPVLKLHRKRNLIDYKKVHL